MASRSVEIFLIANADKWIKGIDKATAKADELGRAIQKQKNIADMSFKAGAALFVGAAGMIAGTIGPALKLEDSVNRVASLTGKTGAAFTALTTQLTTAAKKLSVEMGASLDDVTAAYESAVVNGIDPTTDAFKRFVTQALQVSAVTGQDVKTNIALADEVLDRFGKKLSDAPDALADLYRMSAAAEGGFAPFLQTISQAGAIAGQLDVPLEQVAATVALMSKQGISGTRAGMALGNMLMRLSGASDNASDSLHKFGIKVIDPTTGKVRNLADVFTDLRTLLTSMSKEDANKLLTELAGGQGIKALGGLLRNTEGSFSDLFATIGGGKTLQDAFNERTDAAAFKSKQLKAELEVTRAELGNAYLPALISVQAAIGNVLKTLIPFIQANSDVIAPLTGATLALGLFGMAAGKAAWALTFIRTAFPALLGTLGPIALVITAIAAALILVARNTKTYGDRVEDITGKLGAKTARADELKTKIKELEGQQAVWNKTMGEGTMPELIAVRAELANVTKEADKLKNKLAELAGGFIVPETMFGVSAALKTAIAERKRLVDEMNAGGWEGGEGAPIFGPQTEEIERLNTFIEALNNKWTEIATTQSAAKSTTDDLTTATTAGTAATLAGADATMTLGKFLDEYVSKAKQAKLEAGWLAAPGAAGAALPTGPEEPIIPPLGEQAADEVDLVQSEWARLLESGISTADLLDTGFGAALSDMEPYAQEFADSFIYNFERMQAEGKNVLKSLAASFALAMMDMVKMAIHAAIAQIVATKIAQVAIASMQGFMTFGASLLEIGPILATAAGAIAALSGLQKKLGGYAAGGIVPQTGLVLAHAGERIINPAYNTASDLVNMLSGTRLAAALTPVPVASGAGAPGMAAASFYFHMPIYGNVSSELDMEKVMKKAADVFRSRAG